MNDDQFRKLMEVLERIAVALEPTPTPNHHTRVHTHQPAELLRVGSLVNTADGEGVIIQVAGTARNPSYAVALNHSADAAWYGSGEVTKA